MIFVAPNYRRYNNRYESIMRNYIMFYDAEGFGSLIQYNDM